MISSSSFEYSALSHSSIISTLPASLVSTDAFMADIDNDGKVLPEPKSTPIPNGVESTQAVEGLVAANIVFDAEFGTADKDDSARPQSSSTAVTTSLTDTVTTSRQNSGVINPLTQPKRFSAVNINKKFLEQSSSASSTTQASSTSTAAKSSGSASRPLSQPSTHHSRLVTTKLTSAPQGASMMGPGWSRPTSVTPPVASTTSGQSSNPSLNSASSTASPVTQPLHTGKVIQPQLRATSSSPSTGPQKESNNTQSKLVWANVKAAPPKPDSRVQSDFPTAAEVAQGAQVASTVRKPKAEEPKEDAAALSRQARLEEADTFRGVHLDPNAHHWDEMEEDDDNFLGGVIEFGDGRQYTVQPASVPAPPSSPPAPDAVGGPLDASPLPTDVASTPVSKAERFADDFDRSWPRSAVLPSVSTTEVLSQRHPPGPISPVSPQAHHSPQESSRVLFNERSNRLEPYSNSHRSHQPPSFRRGSQGDFASSPTDLREFRQHNSHVMQKHPGSAPGHEYGPGKGGTFGTGLSRDTIHFRDRRDSAPYPPSDSRRPRDRYNSLGPSPPFNPKDRDLAVGSDTGQRPSAMGPPHLTTREHSRDEARQAPPHLSQVPQSPSSFRSPPLRDSHALPPVGPPSLPASSVRSVSPAHSRTSTALSAKDAPLPLSGSDPRADYMHIAAARAKHRRQQDEEERIKAQQRAKQKAAELEAKMKAETEEKAKVIEADHKSEDESATQVAEPDVKIATPPKEEPATLPLPRSQPSLPSTELHGSRPPALRYTQRQTVDMIRANLPRRPSQTASTSPIVPISPAPHAESWRSKGVLSSSPPQKRPGPLLHQSDNLGKTKFPPSPPQKRTESRLPLLNQSDVHDKPNAPSPPKEQEGRPPLLHQSDGLGPLDLLPNEVLEEVDFSDFGKFVGAEEVSVPPDTGNLGSRIPGPSPHDAVSSDLTDQVVNGEHVTSAQNNVSSSWRRRVPDPSREQQSQLPLSSNSERITRQVDDPPSGAGAETKSSMAPVTSHADVPVSGDNVVSPNQRPFSNQGHARPRATYFKEPAMSALDDAMSRIKGAIDGMQSSDVAFERRTSISSELDRHNSKPPQSAPLSRPAPQTEPRWIPPALRASRQFDLDAMTLELSEVSSHEPPQSPRPAWNMLRVRLPSISIPLEPLNKRQLQLSRAPPAPFRWDTLSWEPPVENMRRDLSINTVLFKKPFSKFKPLKYKVVLPRPTISISRVDSRLSGSEGPRVNLPPHGCTSKFSRFGRPGESDNIATWRKPAPSPAWEGAATTQHEATLDTISRSPPPQTPMMPAAAPPAPLPVTTPIVIQRLRSPPKMPEGSGVAFYRSSHIDLVASNSRNVVNFIVGSELDEAVNGHVNEDMMKPETVASPPTTMISLAPAEPKAESNVQDSHPLTVDDLKSQPSSPEVVEPSLAQSMTETKASDDSVDRTPTTPPSLSAANAWTKSPLSFPLKESPARAPDPEHLKAVWNQASDKARRPIGNSLEGIADDLTALPFTLQDVKCEDGETPPPSLPVAPSRMSLHDVTRAFQQVPSSSSSPSQRAVTFTPPVTNLPLPPLSYAYPMPPPATAMRSPYMTYASPVGAPSPSPTAMYAHAMTPSPVPSRMSVSAHAPVYNHWMSSTPQAGMYRPVHSPYQQPALVSYASPNGPTPMYAPPPPPNMQNPAQTNGVQTNRGRGVQMMTPVLQPAGPHTIFPGSPVLMHPGIPMGQGHGFMPVPTGRGQLRTDHYPSPAHAQHAPTGQSPSLSHRGGFTHVPPSSFVRPSW